MDENKDVRATTLRTGTRLSKKRDGEDVDVLRSLAKDVAGSVCFRPIGFQNLAESLLDNNRLNHFQTIRNFSPSSVLKLSESQLE